MAESTGFILGAAALVAANEIIFAPAVAHKPLFTQFNWRIVPATAVAAVSLAALEKASVPLAKGLAVLGLMFVLIQPIGNAPSPLDNISKMLGVK